MLPFSDEQETDMDLPVLSMPLSQLTEKGGGGSAVEQIDSDCNYYETFYSLSSKRKRVTLAFRQVFDGVFLNAQASMLYIPLSFWSKWPMLTKKTSSSVSRVTFTLLSGPEEGINTSVLGDSRPETSIGC